MDVKIAIEKRRAYRSLEQVEIYDELIEDLSGSDFRRLKMARA